ncbi:MAG: hypothetical protein ACKV19_09460 [Verrucomicrobiales bacterium]
MPWWGISDQIRAGWRERVAGERAWRLDFGNDPDETLADDVGSRKPGVRREVVDPGAGVPAPYRIQETVEQHFRRDAESGRGGLETAAVGLFEPHGAGSVLRAGCQDCRQLALRHFHEMPPIPVPGRSRAPGSVGKGRAVVEAVGAGADADRAAQAPVAGSLPVGALESDLGLGGRTRSG